jgi:hypothetical protein
MTADVRRDETSEREEFPPRVNFPRTPTPTRSTYLARVRRCFRGGGFGGRNLDGEKLRKLAQGASEGREGMSYTKVLRRIAAREQESLEEKAAREKVRPRRRKRARASLA